MARKLTPIRRTALYEEVAERLRAFIADSGLGPGARLQPERELAQRLGVSRTSVRQAITALRVMGLVEVRHGDGIYVHRRADDVVPPIHGDILLANPDVPLVNEAREALESQAARLAARRRTEADLAQMRLALEQMRLEIDGGGTGAEGDWLFHRVVVEAAANQVITRILEQFADTVREISRESLCRPGQPPRSLATHELILEAITTGDSEAALSLMREHLSVTGQVDESRGAAAPSE